MAGGRDAIRQIETMRKFRVKARDLSIGAEIDKIGRELTKRQRAAAGMDAAWEQLAPGELAALSSVERLTPGGVLVVRVSDASAAFEIDQWLRGGGLEALRGRCPRKHMRVKLEQGPAEGGRLNPGRR